MSFIRLAARSAVLPRRALTASLSRPQHVFHIESRILELLKGFDKVDPSKLSSTASFSKDLGLDSLDSVEVVMAVEEEFSIEIPDQEADEIQTVGQAIDYIAKTPEAQ
ncbi:Acyl carrier protein [Pleurotus pulmonarius]